MTVSATFRAESQSENAVAGGSITVVAPAVVLFSAINTTSTTDTGNDAFRAIGHLFNFGDTGSSGVGSWAQPSLHALSDRLKNEFWGHGVTAHLYDEPGTFTVQHKARDSASDEDQSADITIIVQDPEIVYDPTISGNTYYFSTGAISAGSDGIPAGAVNVLSNQTSWPTFRNEANDTRYLLKAGDDFTSFGQMEFRLTSNWQVGKFDTGIDPIIADIHSGTLNPNSHGTSWPVNNTIYDIDCLSYTLRTVTKYHSFIRGRSRTRVDMASALDFLYTSGNPATQAAYEHPQLCAIVDSTIVESGTGTNNTYNGNGRGQIVMGCVVGEPTAGEEHTFRIYDSYESVFQHNQVSRPAAFNRLCMRIHSRGSDPYTDLYSTSQEMESAYNVVERNHFNSPQLTPINWPVEFAPQNDSITPPEGIRDTSFVHNDISTTGDLNELRLGGLRLVEGQNSIEGTEQAISVFTGYRAGAIPSGWDGPYYTNQTLPKPSEFGTIHDMEGALTSSAVVSATLTNNIRLTGGLPSSSTASATISDNGLAGALVGGSVAGASLTTNVLLNSDLTSPAIISGGIDTIKLMNGSLAGDCTLFGDLSSANDFNGALSGQGVVVANLFSDKNLQASVSTQSSLIADLSVLAGFADINGTITITSYP